MALQDLYRSAVLDHNKSPRNFLEMEHASHFSRGLNALCGDDIRVYLKVEGSQIQQLSFIGQASAITMASASMMTEQLTGVPISQALRFSAQLDQLLSGEVDDSLRHELGTLSALEGVRQYPSRIKAARLPWQTMIAALDGEAVATTE